MSFQEMVKHSIHNKQACDMCDKIVVDVQLCSGVNGENPTKKIRLFKQPRCENKVE